MKRYVIWLYVGSERPEYPIGLHREVVGMFPRGEQNRTFAVLSRPSGKTGDSVQV